MFGGGGGFPNPGENMKYKSNMTAAESKRWNTARRSGPGGSIYCAPFCGRGCTYAEYQFAVSMADLLAMSLGHGWKPRVHENMGWFWSAVSQSGLITVCPFIFRGKVRSYTAFLSDAPDRGGRWTGSAKTPRGAVSRARGEMAAALAELNRIAALLAND